MDKTLKDILLDLRSESPYRINEYFATEFADEYDRLEKQENQSVLEFLNDSFTDIDVDYDGSEAIAAKIIDTINKAISMCNDENEESKEVTKMSVLNTREIELLNKMGLTYDFSKKLSWEQGLTVEEKVGDYLTLECLDDEYEPNEEGEICYANLSKIDLL